MGGAPGSWGEREGRDLLKETIDKMIHRSRHSLAEGKQDKEKCSRQGI